MAQVLVDAGFRIGNDLIAGSESNPRGFFEDVVVNRRNDELLESATTLGGTIRLPRSLWWLGAFSPLTDVTSADGRFLERVPPVPFVMKDPRFSYTYPAWEPLLGRHRVVVMVRPIAEVTASLAAMARRDPAQFAGHSITVDSVARMWFAVYDSIAEWADDRVVFVADSTLRDRSVLESLSSCLGVTLTAPNIDAALRRSRPDRPSDAERGVFERCLSC